VTNPRIDVVEWARLEGRRPRHAGSNARLGAHGITVRVPILRIMPRSCVSFRQPPRRSDR